MGIVDESEEWRDIDFIFRTDLEMGIITCACTKCTWRGYEDLSDVVEKEILVQTLIARHEAANLLCTAAYETDLPGEVSPILVELFG